MGDRGGDQYLRCLLLQRMDFANGFLDEMMDEMMDEMVDRDG